MYDWTTAVDDWVNIGNLGPEGETVASGESSARLQYGSVHVCMPESPDIFGPNSY